MFDTFQEVPKDPSISSGRKHADSRSTEAVEHLLDPPPADPKAVHVLTAGWIETPIGMMLAIVDDRGLLRLDFTDEGRAERLLKEMRGSSEKSGANGSRIRTPVLRYSDGPDSPLDRSASSEYLRTGVRNKNRRDKTISKPVVIVAGEHRHLEKLRQELADYFAGRLRTFTVPLSPKGTAFELKAWEFLRKIPYAQTRSYGQQATAIGNPAASRAVGGANGRNPIGIVVPCHRVIGANGSLTGFGGGLPRKNWLLEHERKFAGNELFQ